MKGIKQHKPVTPGRRGYISIYKQVSSINNPLKSLVVNKSKCCGRNNRGRITSWHRGGGHKQLYRIIDWKRNKDGIKAKIEKIEYDPNRSPYIALLLYSDGERRYIICPNNMKVGDFVESGIKVPIKVGNSMILKNITLGSTIHCIELKPLKGAQIVRSAGCYAQLLALDDKYATIRLNSGEVRKISKYCRATIGSVCKKEHNLQKIGKAGRNRWYNKKPRVRGVAMNPIDHPLGGGEGKTSGGRIPCNPWGLVEGTKTRNKKKNSNKLIVRYRRKK